MKLSVLSMFLFLTAIVFSCQKDTPIKKFDFYISTKAYSAQTSQPELTTSTVSVISGRSLFNQDEAAGTTKVSIEDGDLGYTVSVTKSNYITFSQTFSPDQLKAFTANSPLVVTLLDQSLTNGLVACYSLNGNARDCSGNYNDGTLYGTTLAADHSGITNGAYQFNGVSDYISLPAHALKNSVYSYSIWFKADALPSPGNAVCIFSIGDVIDTKQQTLALANNYSSAGTTGMSVGGYNNGLPASSSTLTSLPTVGQWYHIVGVRTSTSLSLYVNGSFVASADAGTTTPYYGTTVAANLGARCNLTQYFSGEIDNFLIYNRAITDQEIKVLYLEGLPCQ